jgi:hypothetical protein
MGSQAARRQSLRDLVAIHMGSRGRGLGVLTDAVVGFLRRWCLKKPLRVSKMWGSCGHRRMLCISHRTSIRMSRGYSRRLLAIRRLKILLFECVVLLQSADGRDDDHDSSVYRFYSRPATNAIEGILRHIYSPNPDAPMQCTSLQKLHNCIDLTIHYLLARNHPREPVIRLS